jgi:hypothetical protein
MKASSRRFESSSWDRDYATNESWSNSIGVIYPLAECLQLIREEKLNEIGI